MLLRCLDDRPEPFQALGNGAVDVLLRKALGSGTDGLTRYERPPPLAHEREVDETARDPCAILPGLLPRDLQLRMPVGSVGEEKADRLLDGTILRSRNGPHLGEEAQERRPLPLVETGDQRQVVVTGERRMRLAARQDAFGVGQEQLLDRGEPSSPLGRPVAAGQHRLAQQRDQAVGLLGMPGAVRFERILGPRVHALGQAHEHLGKVIERLGGLPAQEGDPEGKPPCLDQAADVGGVEGFRLGRELAHLLVGHARKRTVDVLGPRDQRRCTMNPRMRCGLGRDGSALT